jgi:GNAT superfamily N-acetyltransferase
VTTPSISAQPAIRLRPAAPEDDDFLFDLYCAVRAPEFSMLPLPAEQKAQVIRLQYSAQQAAYRSQFPGSSYSIVLHNGRPVGRIWVYRSETSFELVDIALLPATRNLRIGTWLVEQLQVEARTARKPIRSSVFRVNPGSLRFHHRLGFRIIHEDEMQFHLEWNPADAGETHSP